MEEKTPHYFGQAGVLHRSTTKDTELRFFCQRTDYFLLFEWKKLDMLPRYSCRHEDLISKSCFIYKSQFPSFGAIIPCYPSVRSLQITCVTYTKTTNVKKHTFYYTIPHFQTIHFMDFAHRLVLKKQKLCFTLSNTRWWTKSIKWMIWNAIDHCY